MDCIFCKIVRKEAPASFVYEDDRVAAFLDLYPGSPGHILVIPKHHAVLAHELPAVSYGRLMEVTLTLCRALRESEFHRGGILWFLADGPPMQEVPHVHMHLVPRAKGDGFGKILPPGRTAAPRDELDRVAGSLRKALS
jgi:diadenosine tetraphosphate (Ap4A) HIT family hydrolase